MILVNIKIRSSLCRYLLDGRMDHDMFVAEGKYIASQSAKSDWAADAANCMRCLYEFISKYGGVS